MNDYDFIVASQDWHPPDHGSFASQHSGLKPGDRFELNGLQQTAWPDHCVQGTFGAELVAELDRKRIQATFLKGQDMQVDSYSAFFDNGHKHSTGLAAWLREHDVEKLTVMGIATDYCVRFSVLDAVSEGFKVSLLLRGCRGVELKPGDIATAIETMKAAGVEILE